MMVYNVYQKNTEGGANVSNRLAEMRKAANLTQEELAEKSGVSRVTISNIENNNDRFKSTKTLYALARALNTSVEQLFFCDECLTGKHDNET